VGGRRPPRNGCEPCSDFFEIFRVYILFVVVPNLRFSFSELILVWIFASFRISDENSFGLLFSTRSVEARPNFCSVGALGFAPSRSAPPPFCPKQTRRRTRFFSQKNHAASCPPCCGSREVSALIFRSRHANRFLALLLSRNTRLRLSPTALGRSFSLICVLPWLAVSTPLDQRRAVRIPLS
jgi:hypothetical protein